MVATKTRKPMVSAEMFFKLFVCCLYWQWRRGEFAGMFTTMDKVVRIVGPRGLGLLNEQDVRGLGKSQTLLGKFKVHTRIFTSPSHLYHRPKKRDPLQIGAIASEILATPSLLVVRVPMNRVVVWKRVMRDTHLFLTDRGALQAEVWKEEMAVLLTREQYLAECARQAAAFKSEAAHAVSAQAYRRRLWEELGNDT